MLKEFLVFLFIFMSTVTSWAGGGNGSSQPVQPTSNSSGTSSGTNGSTGSNQSNGSNGSSGSSKDSGACDDGASKPETTITNLSQSLQPVSNGILKPDPAPKASVSATAPQGSCPGFSKARLEVLDYGEPKPKFKLIIGRKYEEEDLNILLPYTLEPTVYVFGDLLPDKAEPEHTLALSKTPIYLEAGMANTMLRFDYDNPNCLAILPDNLFSEIIFDSETWKFFNNRERVLDELIRVLQPGGKLVVDRASSIKMDSKRKHTTEFSKERILFSDSNGKYYVPGEQSGIPSDFSILNTENYNATLEEASKNWMKLIKLMQSAKK